MNIFPGRQMPASKNFLSKVFRAGLSVLLLVMLLFAGLVHTSPASAATSKAVAQGPGPAIIVTPTSGLVTKESGTTATFDIQLSTTPTATVIIDVTISDPAEAELADFGTGQSAGQYFFIDTTPQTVTLRGLDDNIRDGDKPYKITVKPTATSASNYAGLSAIDVSATSIDDGPTPTFIVTPTSGLVTTESGGIATFNVSLGSKPAYTVNVNIDSSNTAEGIVSAYTCGPTLAKVPKPQCDLMPSPNGQSSQASIYFDNYNWNQPQTVTVTGVDDNPAVVDGDIPYTVSLLTDSQGAGYNGLSATVSVTNLDNDLPAGVNVTPLTGLVTTEIGGTADFTVKLASPPEDGVVLINVSSSNKAEGTVTAPFAQPNDRATPNAPVNPNTLIFTSNNWNVAQTVRLTGVDDTLFDGDQPYTVSLNFSGSTDTLYKALDPVQVSAINLDNEVRGGATVTPTSGLTTKPGQETVTFSVVLTIAPTGNVYIPLSSSNTGRGTAATDLLVFTPANWNVPQAVTVTGNPNNPGTFSIVTGAATSEDPAYNGYNPADVVINVQGKPSQNPADLIVSLRVSPDRQYNVNSTDLLTYSFEVKNIGPGRAGSAYLRLPIDSNLDPAASAFVDPNTWVEKIVSDTDQPYVQVRLPGIDSSNSITGTISFLPKFGVAKQTTVFTRAWIYWDDAAGTNHRHGSNAVRLDLVDSTTNRNDTGGEVQYFTQVGEPVGTLLTLHGDFYAPNEVVSLWYTPGSGQSVALGTAIADNTGGLSFEINFKDWPVGQPISVAGRGNQSGVIGSSVVTVSSTNQGEATNLKVTLRALEKAELKTLRNSAL